MIEERRKYIRMDAKIDFTYKIRHASGLSKKAVTKNISPGGIRALMDSFIKKGDWLKLSISLPSVKSPISAIGKVIWTADEKTGKIDVGVKFEEISPEMKNKFLEYICELMFSELERLRL
ncbi:MAG: PilZ domain-containing protein [Candidatus Omnitrophota bacterium]